MSGTDSDPQWAWLGLLKWSLSYSDGTRPSSETVQMSAEDKKFLETVMKEGIIDENERMKEILIDLTSALEVYKGISEGKEELKQPDQDELKDLLGELRDIVEQIDYARAFAAMKGFPFLLGCAQERTAVPRAIRIACLGVVATMCQNNPPLQMDLLEMGSIKILSDLYFKESPTEEATDVDADGKMRARIVQALSANVRNHATAEQVFCSVQQAPSLMETALGVHNGRPHHQTPLNLRKRALFFLRALITSDSSDRERVQLFANSIQHIVDTHLDAEQNFEIRELSLELLNQILEQKLSVNVVLDNRINLTRTGAERTTEIESLTGEDLEFAQVELQHWQTLISNLESAEPDQPQSQPTLLLANTSSLPAPPETLPQ